MMLLPCGILQIQGRKTMANVYGVLFDRANDYFALGDDDAYDFTCDSTQDSFYAFWLKVDDFEGARRQYFFSNSSSLGGTGAYNLRTDGTAEVVSVAVAGSGDVTSSTVPLSEYFYFVCQYNKATDKMVATICTEGGTAVTNQAPNIMFNDLTGASEWNMGRRVGGTGSTYFGGTIYNMAKGNQFLSDSEIETLASDFLNYDPTDNAVFTPQIYFPMNEGAGTTITDTQLGLTGTGIGFPTNSHWVLEGTTSGGGGQEITLDPVILSLSFNPLSFVQDKLITLDNVGSTLDTKDITLLQDKLMTLDNIESTLQLKGVSFGGDLGIILDNIGSELTLHNIEFLQDLILTLDKIESGLTVEQLEFLEDKTLELIKLDSGLTLGNIGITGGFRETAKIKLHTAEGYGAHIRSVTAMHELMYELQERIKTLEKGE